MESLTMEKFPSASVRLSVRLPTTTRRGKMYLNLGENEGTFISIFKKLQDQYYFAKFLASNHFYFYRLGDGKEFLFQAKDEVSFTQT